MSASGTGKQVPISTCRYITILSYYSNLSNLYAWQRLLRGAGPGTSPLALHRRRPCSLHPHPKPATGALHVQQRLVHGQMAQDQPGVVWFRKGPAGGLATYGGSCRKQKKIR